MTDAEFMQKLFEGNIQSQVVQKKKKFTTKDRDFGNEQAIKFMNITFRSQL